MSPVEEGIAGVDSSKVIWRFDCGIWGGICIRVGKSSVAVWSRSQILRLSWEEVRIPGLSGSGKPVCLLRTLTSLAGKSWTFVGILVCSVELLRK
jgi:hypothetical protein